jgi:hypothetical protein
MTLTAHWMGNDVTGPATLDGVTYLNVGSLSSDSSMEVGFRGTVVLPPFSDSSIHLTAPFLFNGSFFHPVGDTFQTDLLIGGGVASLSLSPHRGIAGTWHLDEARYDFIDPSAASPAPEPGTLVLMGSGLLGLAALFRRHVKQR